MTQHVSPTHTEMKQKDGKMGTLYGIGVGPGDPELMTVKGANILARSTTVFVPKARIATQSVALEIAKKYLPTTASVVEVVFPMTADAEVLTSSWKAAAQQIYTHLQSGQDACFLTLGDPLLYSTYIYLVRALRACNEQIKIETVPGIMAMAACASLTDFPLGEGRETVTVIPGLETTTPLEKALDAGGTVVIMKVGKRLQEVLELLDKRGLLGQAVFVSHAGMPDQRVVTNLRTLLAQPEDTGYLSVLLVHAHPQKEQA